MSNYGPPGGYPHGQPQEPYGRPADPWGQDETWDDGTQAAPVDPAGSGYGAPTPPGQGGYGGGDRGYGQGHPGPGYASGGYAAGHAAPGYGQAGYPADDDQTAYLEPGYGPQGYPPQPADGTWGEPEPPAKRRSTGLVVAIVVTLVVLLCGGGVTAVLLLMRGNSPAPVAAGQQTSPSPAPSSTAATATPSVARTDARFATKGQCLVNNGTNDNPSLQIVPCEKGTYKVLARFDGTVDFKDKCSRIDGYQFHYYFDSDLNALDFVLCLKKL